ncbi:protein-L-isoaspartate(D-aspartate) O-methyltransferase [Kitasatospora sp. SolWspMP-SS2h]|uniref:methyltransferase domain-containing protein n=1 Tax=Kitasatospora sp. SolWspMP-SS2h TaxID=1305729 RepID=UPI000DB9E359|nr:methyltransferase domain-containing protein [Kitasatospora sp. SolWspMP-SS2h]RAJ47161.1 protein-L-isoaspartate(D-aspartate) O-methyltransferase [Kitasatospora sp. SolWspMP-SS2h]
MTDHVHQSERAALRGLLSAVGEDLGHDVAPEWAAAAEAAPRTLFLPDRIWLGDGHGSYTPCDRRTDPAGWAAAAYANAPVVTQVNDGKDPGDDPWPSSSASAPAIVFRMLEMLDLHPGMTVQEIGTGTGLTAAYMSHRLGSENVVTVEVDPEVTELARGSLAQAGLHPEVVCGDGTRGWGLRAPYDRVSATCALRSVPAVLVEQTKRGGKILTPWDNPWVCWGLLLLTVTGDGNAEGRFSPYGAFMLARNQRTDLRIYRDVVRDEHVPEESRTRLPAHDIAADGWELAFTLGVLLGDVWKAWDNDPDVDGVARRLWLATTDATSWAAVDWAGEGSDEFTVWQYGERRLWHEVAEGYAWWQAQGEPGPERFGLTVTPDGTHRFWLDRPENTVRVRSERG